MNHLFTYGSVPVDEAERVPLKETEFGVGSRALADGSPQEICAYTCRQGLPKERLEESRNTILISIISEWQTTGQDFDFEEIRPSA